MKVAGGEHRTQGFNHTAILPILLALGLHQCPPPPLFSIFFLSLSLRACHDCSIIRPSLYSHTPHHKSFCFTPRFSSQFCLYKCRRSPLSPSFLASHLGHSKRGDFHRLGLILRIKEQTLSHSPTDFVQLSFFDHHRLLAQGLSTHHRLTHEPSPSLPRYTFTCSFTNSKCKSHLFKVQQTLPCRCPLSQHLASWSCLGPLHMWLVFQP